MIMSLKHDHSALDWTLATRAVTANLLQCPEKAPTSLLVLSQSRIY